MGFTERPGRDPRRAGKGRARPDDMEAIRARTDELVRSGIPFQLAMTVARGRITLNDALQTLARQAAVEKLMAQHALSRALATQVALGHADLNQVLSKRRMADHRANHRDRSCLTDALESGTPLTLVLNGKRKVTGKITAVDAYEVTVATDAGPEVIHKLQLLYAWPAEAWKKARKALSTDKAVAAMGLSPKERPQDRYTCSDKRLFGYVDRGAIVEAILLDGEVVSGKVAWFGRFEFAIAGKDVEITVFRHALHNLREV